MESFQSIPGQDGHAGLRPEETKDRCSLDLPWKWTVSV